MACERTTLLIPHTIRELYLNWISEEPYTLAPLFQCICHCSVLELVLLRADDGIEENLRLMDRLAQGLEHPQSIQHLHFPTSVILYPGIWTAIQKLPALQSIICVDYMDKSSGSTIPRLSEHVQLDQGFDALKRIQFRMSHLGVAHLFEKRCPAPVESLGLRIFDADTTASVALVTRPIATSLHALTSLTVFFDNSTTELSYDVLSCFVQLQQLTSFHISSDGASNLSDEDLKRLTQCLPQLEELKICPDPTSKDPAYATLLSLSHIALNCRRMRNVALHIDVSPSKLPSFTTTITPFSNSLQTISFGLSPVGEALCVAQHLLRLLLATQPKYIGYEEGMTRSGRSISSDAELSGRYAATKIKWEEVMQEVSNLRPFADAIKEAADVEIALLQVKVKMLEESIQELKAV